MALNLFTLILLIFSSLFTFAETGFSPKDADGHWCHQNPELALQMMDDLKRDYLCSLGSQQNCREESGYGLTTAAAIGGAAAGGAYLRRRSLSNTQGLCRISQFKPNLFNFSFYEKAWAAKVCHEPTLMLRSNLLEMIDRQIADLENMEKEISESIKGNKKGVHEASAKAYADLEEKVRQALEDPKRGAISRISLEEKQNLLRVFDRQPDLSGGFVPPGSNHEKYQKYLKSQLINHFSKEWEAFAETLKKDKYVSNFRAARENRLKVEKIKNELEAKKAELKKLRHGFTVSDLRKIYEQLPLYDSPTPGIGVSYRSFAVTLDYFDSTTPGGIRGRIADMNAYHKERSKRALKMAGKKLIKFIPLLGPAVAMANPADALEDLTFTSRIGCETPVSPWVLENENCQSITDQWTPNFIALLTQPDELRQQSLSEYVVCEQTLKLHRKRGTEKWHGQCGKDLKITSKEGLGHYIIEQGKDGQFTSARFVSSQKIFGEIKPHRLSFDANGGVKQVYMGAQTRAQRRNKNKKTSFSMDADYLKTLTQEAMDRKGNSATPGFHKNYTFFQSQMAAFTDIQACCRGENLDSECARYGIKTNSNQGQVPEGWKTPDAVN